MSDINYYEVINDQEQYSIWPAFKPLPTGWRGVSDAQSREACLEYIEANWLDVRPRSLRELLLDA